MQNLFHALNGYLLKQTLQHLKKKKRLRPTVYGSSLSLIQTANQSMLCQRPCSLEPTQASFYKVSRSG